MFFIIKIDHFMLQLMAINFDRKDSNHETYFAFPTLLPRLFFSHENRAYSVVRIIPECLPKCLQLLYIISSCIMWKYMCDGLFAISFSLVVQFTRHEISCHESHVRTYPNMHVQSDNILITNTLLYCMLHNYTSIVPALCAEIIYNDQSNGKLMSKYHLCMQHATRYI